MTGTPLVYPTDVGTDATKAFIGGRRRDDLALRPVELRPHAVDGRALPRPLQPDGRHEPRRRGPTGSRSRSRRRVARHGRRGRDQRGDGRDRHVRLERDRVRLLDHREGAGHQHAEASRVRQLVHGDPADAPTTSFTPPTEPEDTPTNPAFLAGERVAGPMVVFDGKLYFATYAVPPPSTVTCVSNLARIWGVDFVPRRTRRAASRARRRLQPRGRRRAGACTGRSCSRHHAVATASDASCERPSSRASRSTRRRRARARARPRRPTSTSAAARSTRRRRTSRRASFSLSAQVGAPGANGTGTQTINLERPDAALADGHRLVGGGARVKLATAGCAAARRALAACRSRRRRRATRRPPVGERRGRATRRSCRPTTSRPGELLEGTDKAFDVTLPRGLQIDGAFSATASSRAARCGARAGRTYFARALAERRPARGQRRARRSTT